jgi:hypothetical protein
MRYSRILAVGFVTLLLSLSMISTDSVKADGIPITKQKYYGTLRENRQLAFISVNDNGTEETLNLFLSVVSLYPGNNVSVLIPLMTKPREVAGEEMTEREFRQRFDFNMIESQIEKQNHGSERVLSATADCMGELARFQLTGILGAYTMVIGFGADGGEYYEISDSMSFKVHSFDSSDSIEGYYDSLGLEVPAKVQDIIEEYGEFHLGIINATTRAPIDEETFSMIESECPGALNEFRAFVEENPSIETYSYFDWGYIDTGIPALDNILYSIEDYELRYEFSTLISSTYGFGEQNGALISFNLPLEDGLAYFPLGTTPAWNGVQHTQVIFKVNDDKYLDFSERSEEAYVSSNHYYMWDFNNEAPDYDLIGTVKSAGIVQAYEKFKMGLSIWYFDNATLVGFTISMTTLILIWMVGIWLFIRHQSWWIREKYKLPKIIGIAIYCMFTSMFLTILMGILVAILILASIRNSPFRKMEPEYYHWLDTEQENN